MLEHVLFAMRVLLRTAKGTLHIVFALAVVASFWRQRAWQLLVYGAMVTVIVSRWRWTSGLENELSDASAMAVQFAVPLLCVVVTCAALSAARRVPGRRRAITRCAIGAILMLWLICKLSVIREHVPALARTLGTGGMPVLGLSYAILKLLHVLADAARPAAPATRPTTVLAMAFFPPTYASGPMHRYDELAASFDALPAARERDWATAIRRITWGTFKVSVLAAHLADWVLPVFANPGAYGAGSLWLAVYGYAAYIYIDFAGVSDIAIGLGAAFGVAVPENFGRPYLQLDIQSFWRSWHITLTRWLQAYIFMPVSRRLVRTRLRRRPKLVASIGYLATFAFCGVWHGDTIGFLLWGLYHGLGLCTYSLLPARLKIPPGSRPSPLRRLAWWAVTFHFVALGWVLFACPLPTALRALAGLVGLG